MLGLRNAEGQCYVRAKLREPVICAQNRGSMQGALKAEGACYARAKLRERVMRAQN